ncbi:MAG: phosphatase PAP2 family protein [Candidatus Marinimicrobia bacterium]|jgi:undecaprenyl-diphosphatase|nr:phosphatase PAP2 family protein [Candidatus Neomarinimicrobiota bacterium]MBT5339379.1 phosphatase PAP2 family protein [Candidatus Neomarinimicrobiota bacterium]MBT6000568.1 phosphatase PAP2 family protein [Candidatus Neomarinimicrobiota bacterium]
MFSLLNQGVANPVFDFVMPFITNQNNWILPILFGFAYLGWKDGKRGLFAIGILFATFIFTDVVCAQIIKPLVGRLRPSHDNLEGLRLLVGAGGQFGFVSNHAANSFAAAFVLGSFYKKIRVPLFVLATVIAFSRIYVGVHYPADIIVGALVGILFGGLVLKLFSQSPWKTYLEKDI